MSSSPPPSLPPALRAKILGQLAEIDAPTRPRFQRAVLGAMALGLAASVLLFLAIGGVELGRRPLVYVTALGASWLVLLALAAPGALMRGRSSVGRPSRTLSALSIGLPLLVLGAIAATAWIWPETRTIADNRSDLRCFGFALALGAGPFAAIVWVKRKLVLVHPHVEAGAAGVLAGALGAFFITLRCDCSELDHLLIGHVVPVVLFGALSAWLIGRLFARTPLSA